MDKGNNFNDFYHFNKFEKTCNFNADTIVKNLPVIESSGTKNKHAAFSSIKETLKKKFANSRIKINKSKKNTNLDKQTTFSEEITHAVEVEKKRSKSRIVNSKNEKMQDRNLYWMKSIEKLLECEKIEKAEISYYESRSTKNMKQVEGEFCLNIFLEKIRVDLVRNHIKHFEIK